MKINIDIRRANTAAMRRANLAAAVHVWLRFKDTNCMDCLHEADNAFAAVLTANGVVECDDIIEDMWATPMFGAVVVLNNSSTEVDVDGNVSRGV